MPMSRKDFNALALAIRPVDPLPVRQALAERVADYLRSTNPLFDRKRFLEACEVAS